MEQCHCKKTIRTEEEKKELKSRLNRIEGQVRGISKMIDEDRYCDDVLIQVAAALNALKSVAHGVLERHLATCVVREIKNGNVGIIDEVTSLMKRLY